MVEENKYNNSIAVNTILPQCYKWGEEIINPIIVAEFGLYAIHCQSRILQCCQHNLSNSLLIYMPPIRLIRLI